MPINYETLHTAARANQASEAARRAIAERDEQETAAHFANKQYDLLCSLGIVPDIVDVATNNKAIFISSGREITVVEFFDGGCWIKYIYIADERIELPYINLNKWTEEHTQRVQSEILAALNKTVPEFTPEAEPAARAGGAAIELLERIMDAWIEDDAYTGDELFGDLAKLEGLLQTIVAAPKSIPLPLDTDDDRPALAVTPLIVDECEAAYALIEKIRKILDYDFINDIEPAETVDDIAKRIEAFFIDNTPDDEPEPEREFVDPGYTGDGFTGEYDYDHPVHGKSGDDDEPADSLITWAGDDE